VSQNPPLRPAASRLAKSGSVLGSGTSTGPCSLCSSPSCASWNEADNEKIGSPFWIASTRRVVNERPSRTRSVV
jgi:hypothetical protein